MGQRSQIYVRLNNKDGSYNLYARYFQWNYGTRMISRARYTIEWLQCHAGCRSSDFDDCLVRIIDTNFDYKDICISSDIMEQCRQNCDSIDDLFDNYYLFSDDNNNGKLFVDVNIDYSSDKFDPNIIIKYAFTDYDNSRIMTGNGYMMWDAQCYVDTWQNTYPNEVNYTNENIAYIDKNAQLMTIDELEAFMNHHYFPEAIPFH